MSGRELQLPENVEFNYTVFYLVRVILRAQTLTCLLLIQKSTQTNVYAGKVTQSIPCVFAGIIYQY